MDQSQLLASDLKSLLVVLRHHGFSVGIDSVLAIERLLREVARSGKGLASPIDLRRIIAPVVCKSAHEQADFSRIFFAWREATAKPAAAHDFAEEDQIEEVFKQVQTEDASATKRVERTARRSRWLMWAGIVSVAVLVAVLLAFAVFGQIMGTSEDPVTVVETEEVVRDTAVAIEEVTENGILQRLFLAGSVFLLPAGFVWFRHHRLRILQRRFTTRLPQSRAVALETAKQLLFASPAAERSIQLLRQHLPVESRNLDVRRTLAELTKNAGLTRLIYRDRRVLPEHVLLVDRASEEDHLRGVADMLEQRLVQANAPVIRFEFHRDPRVLRRRNYFTGDMEDTLMMKDVAALFGNQRLILLGDASSLFYSFSGIAKPWLDELKAWERRAILTPKAPSSWGNAERQLVTGGFIVGEATTEGLRLIAEALRSEEGADCYVRHDVEADQTHGVFPHLLEEEPNVWLEENPPSPATIHQLIEELRSFLGEATFRWCCACSAFPKLQPELTLHLGAVLSTPSGEALGSEAGLLALSQLPWFRKGFMPDWLRMLLLEEIEPRERRKIRTALIEVLMTAKAGSGPGLVLKVSDRSSGLAADFIERATSSDSNNPVREEIFLSFLRGGNMPVLALPTPPSLIQLVRRKVDPYEFLAWTAAVGAFVVLYWLDPWVGVMLVAAPVLEALFKTVPGLVTVLSVAMLTTSAIRAKRTRPETALARWFLWSIALLANIGFAFSEEPAPPLIAAALFSTAVAGLSYWPQRWRRGVELTVYWFGCSTALGVMSVVVYSRYFDPSDEGLMHFISMYLLIFILIGVSIVILRRPLLYSVELAIYWLFCCGAGVALIGFLAALAGFGNAEVTYILIGAAISSLIVVWLLRGLGREEDRWVALPIYWIGFVLVVYLIAIAISSLRNVFEPDWLVGASGLMTVCVAVILIGKRWPNLSSMEVALFWLGGMFVIPTTVNLINDPGQVENVLMILSAGLLAVFGLYRLIKAPPRSTERAFYGVCLGAVLVAIEVATYIALTLQVYYG